jgi:hypothetical protein
VRRTLEVAVEEEAQPLEDKLKERLVDIVRECQSQLVSMFQTTQPPSNVSTSRPASIPGLESKPGFSAPKPPQNDGNTTDIPFRGFESVMGTELEFLTMPALPASELPKPEESAEGSPDSGYDSTGANVGVGSGVGANGGATTFQQEREFPTASNLLDQATAFEQQPNYLPVIPFLGNEYTDNGHVDLGGYYGLFEHQNSGFDTMDPLWYGDI